MEPGSYDEFFYRPERIPQIKGEDVWGRMRSAEAKLAAAEKLIGLIEDFCESHRPFAEGKSEVVTRRILDAIHGRPEVLPPVTEHHPSCLRIHDERKAS